jgi:hypothetical protein
VKKNYITIFLVVVSLNLIYFFDNNQYVEATVTSNQELSTNRFFEDFSNYSTNNWFYTTYGWGSDLFIEDADPATYIGSGWNTPFLVTSDIPDNLKKGINITFFWRMRTNNQEVDSRSGSVALLDSNDNIHAFGPGISLQGPYIRSDLNNNTVQAFNYTSWPINQWIWFKIHSYRIGAYRDFEVSYNLNEGSATKPEIWTRDKSLDNITPWHDLRMVGVYVSHWQSSSTIQKWEFDDFEIIDETSLPDPSTISITPYDIRYFLIFSLVMVLIERRRFQKRGLYKIT